MARKYTVQNSLDLSSDGPGDPDIADITDADFIKSGVAQIPPLIGKYGYSNILFNIPSNYIISGNSLGYQVVVKNTNEASVYDYDVVLQITGDLYSAELHFVADASAQPYNQFYIGNNRYSNLPKLVSYFGDFATIKWVMKKNKTGVYVNGKLVYNFKYSVSDKIENVRSINSVGKGYITIDDVKLLNSITNKKIMTEDFNIDCQSHTLFYCK